MPMVDDSFRTSGSRSFVHLTFMKPGIEAFVIT